MEIRYSVTKREKRTLGDLSESIIVAEGHDEETGMPKMQVEQNFEYKEEV